MKKAQNVNEFVEKFDSMKKLNPKDLSSDQDLTIAIMNLISIEEHLIFSGAKTGKDHFFDLIEQVREMRKNLMLKIIPSYEGEVWCISKHLLASSMRLMEVGTKQQSMGNKKEAYALFNQAYDLYCLFWGLNMNLIDTEQLKWVEDCAEDIKKISARLEASGVTADETKEQPEIPAEAVNAQSDEDKNAQNENAFSKMKRYLRKTIDCCIE